ncbi:DNA ligase 3, partial [Nephila pilipes]
LEAIHPSAYEAFQASRNLEDIVKRCKKAGKKGNLDDHLDAKSTLMTPVLPMLAMACKDLELPFKKYPEGFYVEIKYDGERVQIHKRGQEFGYYSRSLKPVMPHKVAHFKDYIPKAFPYGNDLMLDCEILLVDNEGKPLPFGTLGAHR